MHWHQLKDTNSLILQPGLCAAKEAFSPTGVYQWKHFSTQLLLVNMRFQTLVAWHLTSLSVGKIGEFFLAAAILCCANTGNDTKTFFKTTVNRIFIRLGAAIVSQCRYNSVWT